MDLYSPSVQKIISVMLSTDIPHYAAELAHKAGVSEQWTYKVLAALKSAGITHTWDEDLGFCRDRAPCKFSELTEPFLNTFRVTPLSSLTSRSG
jgi:hypothetical protein